MQLLQPEEFANIFAERVLCASKSPLEERPIVNKTSGTRIVDQGRNSFLIKVTPEGIVRQTIMEVTLLAEKGHFYLGKGKGKEAPPRIITAQGFVYLNSLAPLSFIPQTTLVNNEGKVVGNPSKDLVNKTVTVRRFAVGRSWDGSLRAHDLTLTYDLNAYFAADVLAKYNYASYGPNGSTIEPPWGKIVNERAAERLLDSKDTWSYVRVAPGVCLAFDCTFKLVRELYREHAEREKFPDRQATALCNRNILKNHFGFTHVPEDGKVKICCWHSEDLEFEKLEQKLVTRNGIVTIDGEEIAVEVTRSEATREDLESAVVDDEPPVPDDAPKAKPTESPEEWRSILRGHLKKMPKAWRDRVADPLCQQAGLSGLKDMATCENIELMKTLIARCKETVVDADR